MKPVSFPGLKGNHWLGISSSQTPTHSHTMSTPRAAARQAAQHNITKYSKLASAYIFDPIAIETAGHIGWHSYWASPRDRQTHHNHPGHQRNSLTVSKPVRSPAAGECGLLPQDNEHRMRSRCSHCLTLFLVFTLAALCWWVLVSNNN